MVVRIVHPRSIALINEPVFAGKYGMWVGNQQ